MDSNQARSLEDWRRRVFNSRQPQAYAIGSLKHEFLRNNSKSEGI